MRSILSVLFPGLLLATNCTIAVAVESAEDRSVTMVNRIEIVIDRPAEVIWPFVIDLTKWATNQKVEYLNDHWGEPGGRLRRRTFKDGMMTQDRFEEIIAIEPDRRMTVRVEPAPPNPEHTDVIANIELIPAGDERTVFRLDVYTSTELAEPLDFAGLQKRKHEIESATTRALLARYQQLKEAVELAPLVATDASRTAAGDATATAQVNALADELLAHLRETSAATRLQSGLPISRLDDLTIEQARRESEFSREMGAKLDSIVLADLPHEQWLLAQMLRHAFASGVHAVEDYWLDFVVTPYSGGLRILGVHQIFAAQPLKNEEDRNNYLRLLGEYVAMLEQIAARTQAQAERGIRVPEPAIAGVRATLSGMKASAPKALEAAPERFAESTPEERAAFQASVAKQIAERIMPAYDRILAIFDASYVARAPSGVGLSQFPGGQESYIRRITDGTGLKFTPQQIHDRGLADVAELERKMAAIRAGLGFAGDRAAFHNMLRTDPRFLAQTPQEIEQRYLKYMKRIEPHIQKYFSRLPRARYGVKRVDPAAEAGMTYGYYERPTPAQPVGYYRYNGSNLNERSLVDAANLIYHELIPGHHFHTALQAENKDVHPVREFLYYGAFGEGWAEYGASLAEEMGMYDDPYDLYGHLLSQAFLATRMVVDTGMNYFGWPLERARQFMRDHTFASDLQIASESLRYSTDLFGQALHYRLGYEQFWNLRWRAEVALGDRFDIRKFHAAAVGSGAMPLDVLAAHIDWFIAQEQQAEKTPAN